MTLWTRRYIHVIPIWFSYFNDTSTIVGHLCHIPGKGRKRPEELVEEGKQGKRGRPGK